MANSPITAVWIGGNGNWTTTSHWQELNPKPPYGVLHYEPNAADAVSIGAYTVAFATDAEVWSLQCIGTLLELESGHLLLDHDSRLAGGALYLASPATLNIGAGATLALATTTASLSGFVRGAGTLEIDGATTLGSTNVTVAALFLHNQTLTVGTSLGYAGAMTEQSSAGLNLDGFTLTLSGIANAFGGSVSGLSGGVLKITGAAELASPRLGGYFQILAGAMVEDAKSITQEGDIADHGLLQVDASAIYTIAVNARIKGGTFTSAGTLTIGSGLTLDLAPMSATLGGAVTGAGVLEIDGATTLAASILTVAKIALNNQTLTLGADQTYSGVLTEQSSSGLNLNGHLFTLAGSGNILGGSVSGPIGSTLKVTGVLDLAAPTWGGYFQILTGAMVEDADAIIQDGDIGNSGAIQIDAGAIYTVAANAWINGGAFANSGTLTINAGKTLFLAAASATLGGAVAGAGTLEIDGLTTFTSTSLTVAEVDLNNQTLTLAAGLSYAGVLIERSSAALNLNGHLLTLSGSADAFGGAISGTSGGTLKVTGATDLASSALGGYLRIMAGVLVEDAHAITQDGDIANSGALQIDAGATYTIAASARIDGGTFDSTGTLTINVGQTLSLAAGNAMLGGAVSGSGILEIDGATIFATTNVGVAELDLANQTLTLAESLSYAGALIQQSSGGLNLNGHVLTLSGSANALGGDVSGATGSTLDVTGAADLASPTWGGYFAISAGVTVEDAKLITQDGDIGGLGRLQIDARATYTITASSSIAVATFANAGKLTVSSGLLDVETSIGGTGTELISGASQLEFDAAVVGQTVDFTGSGGALLLGDPFEFGGKISGFDTAGAGAKDMISLTGAWTPGLFAENAADTAGALTLTSGASHLTLDFSGNYLNGHFAAKAGAGATLLTYA